MRVATRPPSPPDDPVEAELDDVGEELVDELEDDDMSTGARGIGGGLASEAGGFRVAVRPPSPELELPELPELPELLEPEELLSEPELDDPLDPRGDADRVVDVPEELVPVVGVSFL